MTPEEIQNMTISEYREFRERNVFDPDWFKRHHDAEFAANVESVRRKLFPNGIKGRTSENLMYDERAKMSEADFKRLIAQVMPSEDEVRRTVDRLMEQADAAEEEEERIALREELKRLQDG